SGFMFASLKPLNQRAGVDAIINRLRPKLARISGAATFLQAVQDIRMGGRQSSAMYQYTLQAETTKDLQKYGPLLLDQMKNTRGFEDVNSDQQDRGLQALLTYDRPTAARLGITPQVLDNTLYNAFGQAQISTIYTPLNQYYVVMEVAPEFWQSPEALRSTWIIPRAGGGAVPIRAVANYAPSTAPLAVNHTGLFPSVTVSFNLDPGVSLGEATQQIQQIQEKMGMPRSIYGPVSGLLAAI